LDVPKSRNRLDLEIKSLASFSIFAGDADPQGQATSPIPSKKGGAHQKATPRQPNKTVGATDKRARLKSTSLILAPVGNEVKENSGPKFMASVTVMGSVLMPRVNAQCRKASLKSSSAKPVESRMIRREVQRNTFCTPIWMPNTRHQLSNGLKHTKNIRP